MGLSVDSTGNQASSVERLEILPALKDVSRETCLVLCKSYLSYFKFEVKRTAAILNSSNLFLAKQIWISKGLPCG